MRNLLLTIAGLMLVLSPLNALAETSLSERLEGRILLQVEDHGEAWYVIDGLRYYMKDGPTAYQMMREFGLGISEEDFANIETDEEMNERLRGTIVLRVLAHGEAYYIHPDDGSVNYLQNGEAAYSVMRFLSLGITNDDLAKIETGVVEMPIVLGETQEVVPVVPVVEEVVEEEPEVIIIREIVREPTIIYVEVDTAEEQRLAEAEAEAVRLEALAIEQDVRDAELERIIAELESIAQAPIKAWEDEHYAEMQQLYQDWGLYSGCLTYGIAYEGCAEKIAEGSYDTDPLSYGCYNRDGELTSCPDPDTNERRYTRWDTEVMKPITERYNELSAEAFALSIPAQSAINTAAYLETKIGNNSVIGSDYLGIVDGFGVSYDPSLL